MTLPELSILDFLIVVLIAWLFVVLADTLVDAQAKPVRRDPDLLRGIRTRGRGLSKEAPQPQPQPPPQPPYVDPIPEPDEDCPDLIISKTQSKMQGIAVHIEEAQQAGQPLKLHRGEGTEDFRKTNRKVALRGYPSPPSNYSWDEYPFASTIEGGKNNTSVKLVPLSEQRVQGGVLHGFYTIHGLGYGDCFFVVIVP